MEQHDNTTNENNSRKSIEFKIPIPIGTQDTTYDYNEKFWYLPKQL